MTVGGNIKMQLLCKAVWQVLKKSSMEVSYDAAILLLRVYTKEPKAGSQRAVCMPMLIAIFFTTVKRWDPGVH